MRQPWTFVRKGVRSEYFVLGLCLLYAAVIAPFAPGFFTTGNAANILASCLPLLLLATGQTLVLITGGIDLSIGSILGVASVIGGLMLGAEQGWLPPHAGSVGLTVLAMLAAGGAIGCINGACVAWLRMPAFMVTLISMMFFGGFSIWLAKITVNAESVYNLPALFLGIGGKGWVAGALTAGLVLAAHVMLSRTLPGRWLYAVGRNSKAALISGVPVARVILLAYVLSGLFAAAAAILLTGRLETASATHGRTLLLDVIGAVVIGGTSLFGGKGKILWTLSGVLFLAILGNGLNLLNVSDFAITIIKGLVILMAALLDGWRSRLADAETG